MVRQAVPKSKAAAASSAGCLLRRRSRTVLFVLFVLFVVFVLYVLSARLRCDGFAAAG